MIYHSRDCLTCGVNFTPEDNRAKYCCSKCRNNSPSKKIRTRLFQRARRDMINAVKLERGCGNCGYRAHPAALQFNHISGTKDFNISQDTKRSLGKINNEIDKCEILCANCHSVHTYENRHWHSKRKTKSDQGSVS